MVLEMVSMTTKRNEGRQRRRGGGGGRRRWWWSGKLFPFSRVTPGICGILPKIFTLFRPKSVIFPSPFILGRFFQHLVIRFYTVSISCYVSLNLLPPPPPNTVDCSLSILGCQKMLKSRRDSMKEGPELILSWVEVFPTSIVPLGWLFFCLWKYMKSKSHPFRGAVLRDLN